MKGLAERVVASFPMTIAVAVAIKFSVAIFCGPCSANDSILGPKHAAILMPDVGDRVLGFTTQLEIANETSAGYLPIRITVNAQGRLPADRRLTYRFGTSPGGQTPPRNGLTVDVPISLQQGMTSASFIRYLPKWSAGQAMEISIIEDGRVLEGYTAFVGGPVGRGRRFHSGLLSIEHEINWVFISSEDDASPKTMPDLRNIVPAKYNNNQVEFESPAGASSYWSQVILGPHLLAIGQKDVPSDWRGYQRYDFVLIESKGLRRLQTADLGLRALRGWVLNGGTVIVYDAESPQSVLSELNFSWTSDTEAAKQIRTIVDALNDVTDPSEKQIEKQILQQIWMQPVGAGAVIGIQKSDFYSVPPRPHWQIVASTIGYRASPMLRRGVDPLVGDRRFAKWMIPGVAEPPVYTFMGLLTAFVALVGPVAYRLTAKHGRSYLMFAIAPALALATTGAMFGYGIMSDGFGTVVRARQLTWVDGRSGDAGERVRATYFAGVRPGDGLRFPGDAEVIGYPEGVGKSWEDLNQLSPATIGKVLIRDDSQVFDSSFLPSREQRQFVVHAPRNNVGYLRLIPDSDATSSASVENGFDFVLHEAVIRNSRGEYWFVEHLAGGETALCTPLSHKDSSKTLGRIYNEHRPLSRVRETRRRQSYNNEIYDVIVDANRKLQAQKVVTEGIFESWLQLHLQTSGEIPGNHFVATADVSSDALAVEGSELVDSVRYVFGTLR